MSLRSLKKKQMSSLDENIEEIDSEDEEEEVVEVKGKFSMLDLDEDEQELEEEEEEEEEEIVEVKKKPKQQQKQQKNQQQQQKSQPKKDTKKKDNKKNNNNNNSKSSKKGKKSDDILDQFIESNKSGTGSTPGTTDGKSSPGIYDKKSVDFFNLFKVTSANLNPDNELKRLLGCSLSDLKSIDKKKSHNPHSNYNLSNIKKNFLFVPPKQDWPYILKTMVMEVDKPSTTTTTTTTTKSNTNNNNNNNESLYKEGIQYFKIRWSQSYIEMQDAFYKVLESHNPMAIVELLKINPYHIDSLLQLSQVCLQSADFQNAGEFVERAVFAFEVSWHHLFNPLNMMNTRLEYRHDENKSSFLAMFRYIQILGRRGCPMTALEFCKLLLQFDHKDPLYIRLVIDYYAIRSKQYKFLLDLYENIQTITPESTQSLSLLPNFCYSAALAAYLTEEEASDKKHLKSNDLLQKALISFPSLLKPLVEKLKTSLVEIIQGKSKNLVEEAFFNMNDNSGIDHLVTLYIERNHALWQSPSIISWVQENVKSVLEMIQSQPDLIEKYQRPVKDTYATMDSNIFDHLVLSEYSDVVQRFPPDILEAMRREGYANMAPERIDPNQAQQPQARRGLGNGVQIYQQQQMQRQLQHLQQQLQNQEINQQQQAQLLQQYQQLQNHRQPILHDAVPHAANPIIDFLQTLLPWNDPTQQLQRQQQQQNGDRGFLDDYIDFEDYEEEEEEQ